jgi:hypothetical protein
VSRVPAGVLVALCALGACSTASGDDDDARTAGLYEAVLRWAIAAEGLRPDEDGDLPVVYVVASDGSSVAPEVQVDVVNALLEEADLRFSDARDDALDAGEEGQPVKDEGLLVVIGTVPPEGVLVEMGVELYRTDDQTSAFVLGLAGSGERWNVTEEVPLE